jgi:glyoxylase-like metal-dependent hydrolase (beta-lactamase superfamily II)
MPTRLFDDVYLIQVPSLFPVGATNSYLFAAGEPSLIDVGLRSRKSHETLVKELGSLELSSKNIQKIIITHAHVDHFGLIHELQEDSSCDVFVHSEDFEFVSDYTGAYLKRMDYFRDILLTSGTPQKILDDLQAAYLFLKDVGGSVENCRKINDGDTVRLGDVELKAFHTPGHTIGEMVLLWEEKETLFCGDHLLSDITPNVGVTLRGTPVVSLLPDYLRSLEKTLRLPGRVAFPGHRSSIQGFRERALEILDHHRERKRLMFEAIRRGEKTPFEVSRTIFGKVSLSEVPLAIAETMSHMQVLESEGKVYEKRKNGVIHYGPNRDE